MSRKMVTIDGNQACTHVAYATSEVITLYPITPSTPLAAEADSKSAGLQKNIWGSVPAVNQMQSEAGVAGSIHGSLTTGALCTTFTASQGLLLMIPNMYKIAGELTPTVFHVTARAIACQGLSIFGDHSDIYAARQTGWAMLCSQNVQEAMDMSLISMQSTLASRIPFIHFFDGFRTSHEIQKIEEVSYDQMSEMIDEELIFEHRHRALSPDHPTIRGTAQNPDVFFTGRETVNKYYNAVPALVQETMDKFAGLTGRRYHLFDYHGAPDAENVIVMMGSGCETAAGTIDYLVSQGEKVGMVIVRLYRPFDCKAMVNSLPATVERITVLDRTKEPGSSGEPLYLDVRAAVGEASEVNTTIYPPIILSGRYGLGSAEFTPAMVKAVFDNMNLMSPKTKFCVGPDDDVTYSSLSFDPTFNIEGTDVYRAMFYGLGSDGTVGANKNTIKIIGTETDNSAQGYFVYDSKKSGSITTSHLRFGKTPVIAPYLINKANFIACHNFTFLNQVDMLTNLEEGGTFLLTTSYDKDTVWNELPGKVQKDLVTKNAKFYIIDAVSLGLALGLGARINMIMQTAFFLISGILTEEQAIAAIKKAIYKTYGKKGDKVVEMNYGAVDAAVKNITQVPLSDKTDGKAIPSVVPDHAPKFVKEVTARIIEGNGYKLKVSQIPADGTWPTGTTQYEKRNIAVAVPRWLPENCIQCGQCALVCPHAANRIKIFTEQKGAPETFVAKEAVGKGFKGKSFALQIFTEDCCGCTLCVSVCPAKTKALEMIPNNEDVRRVQAKNVEYFLSLPEIDPADISLATVKGSQLMRPLFEFSGACAGCGETPYIKLITQMFGDRMYVGNATGCSSIYGGNLPTTPYTFNKEGRGPAWANSLFEDNAEFGLGFRLTLDKQLEYASDILPTFVSELGQDLIDSLLKADQTTDLGIKQQRERVDALKQKLAKSKNPQAKNLAAVADSFVKKSVWIVGGDGWAYDIGYGGLDHVLSTGRNVNLLVLDTEVYSNTGGQASKSTPRGAVARFAASGKGLSKKDIGLMAIAYGYVYVARVAMGYSDQHTLKAFIEAEAYNGPSIIIAYSHCIAHGIDMAKGLEQQKLAVQSGLWPLYRFDPRLGAEGKNPLQIDCKEPTVPVEQYMYNETRFRMLTQSDEARAETLLKLSGEDAKARWNFYSQLAAMHYGKTTEQK